MNSSARGPKIVNGLALLQSRFALSSIGGEVRVLDFNEVAKIQRGSLGISLNFYKKSDASLLMRRMLEEQPVLTKPKDDIENFYIDPDTSVYRSTVFKPGNGKEDELNLWSDPPIKAAAGDWSLLRLHIDEVICSSCPVKSAYVLNFLAHMLQKPEEKPGVMIVLKGRQGTGKNAFLEIVQRIWSGTCLFTADIDHIVGRFNGALERSFVVLLDEALFKGNKKAVDRMKSLVSEPRCHIEVKYQPSRTIDSLHRFFASTNHRQFSHTDTDDRRHAFFEVSDSKRKDSAYFDELFAAIHDDQVIAAMIHDLENHDITGFNVRAAPKTSDHGDQVLRSLSGLDRYWYHLLTLGEIAMPFGFSDGWDSEGLFVATKDLLDGYKSFDALGNKYERPTMQDVSQLMKCRCPGAEAKRVTKSGQTRRGFILPDVDRARNEFEVAIGVAISWD